MFTHLGIKVFGDWQFTIQTKKIKLLPNNEYTIMPNKFLYTFVQNSFLFLASMTLLASLSGHVQITLRIDKGSPGAAALLRT